MKKNFYLIGLTIIFCIFFNKEVSKFIDFVIPNKKISIRSIDTQNSNIILLQTDENIINLKNYNNIEFIPKGKYGYQYNAFWSKKNEDFFEIEIKANPYSKISFYNIGSDKIEISYERNKEIMNLDKSKKGEVINYFPLKKDKLLLIYILIIWNLIILLVYKLIKLLVNQNVIKDYI